MVEAVPGAFGSPLQEIRIFPPEAPAKKKNEISHTWLDFKSLSNLAVLPFREEVVEARIAVEVRTPCPNMYIVFERGYLPKLY